MTYISHIKAHNNLFPPAWLRKGVYTSWSLEGLAPEDAPILVAVISFYFLTLLSLVSHDLDAGIVRFVHLLEHLVIAEVFHVPLMQLQHVCDTVDTAIRLQQKRIFRQEASVDDSASIVLGLEMRVREADEDFFKTSFGEVLTKMTHSIGTDHRNVIEFPWSLDAVCTDLLCYVVHQFVANLHS